MFKVLRINDPYRLIFPLLLLIVVRIVYGLIGIPETNLLLRYQILGERLTDGAGMYREVYDYTAPLMAMVFKGISSIAGRSVFAYAFISAIIIFLNAFVFNRLLLRAKAFKENNYLPAFFLTLFSLSVPDFMLLTPQLISLFFVLLALNNVFRRIDNEVTDELFLFAGIYLGIATLCYIPSFIFFFTFIVALVLYSSPIFRRILLYLYGFLLPIFITWGLYYFYDAGWYFVDSAIFRVIFGSATYWLSWKTFMIGLVPLLVWTLFSAIVLAAHGRFNTSEVRVIQVMFFLAFSGVICVLLDNELSFGQFILFAPVAAFFVTHMCLIIDHRIWRRVIPVLLLISTVFFPNMIYRSDLVHTATLDVITLSLSGQRVMAFSDEIGYYSDNTSASPVIDPVLSKKRLAGIKNYRQALEIYHAISQKPADIIIDDWGIVPELFLRFPDIEKKYKKTGGNRYSRISDN